MIIDFHTHCYNEDLAKKARERVFNALGAHPFFDCTFDGLKKMKKNAGIDTVVLLNIANRPETTINVNNWAIECNKHEGIIAFGSVHPGGSYKDELKRLKDNGIKGIKLHPYYQHFIVNDKSVFPMYEEIIKNGFIMLFHCGIDMLIPGEYCTPRLFKDVIKEFEGEKIVAAHLGGMGYFEDSAEFIFGKDIYLDTSISYRHMTDLQRRNLFANHNNEKILFATDMPWAEPSLDIDCMKKTVTDEQLFKKVTYQNAKKLLGI